MTRRCHPCTNTWLPLLVRYRFAPRLAHARRRPLAHAVYDRRADPRCAGSAPRTRHDRSTSKGPGPVRPCRRPSQPQWGGAARSEACWFHCVVFMLCCALRGLSVLSPGLPCSHQRVEPTTPCTPQGGFAVHAVLQGGRCLPHPPDYGPTTPVSAACGAGVTGAPGTHPCTVMPLLTWGAGRGAGARMPRYRRRGRSNLRPACALERPQGPGPGMSPGCVQCALIALFVNLRLYLGLFGVTCVAACLGRLACA